MKANKVLVHHRDGISVAVKIPLPPIRSHPSRGLCSPAYSAANLCDQQALAHSRARAARAQQVRRRRRRVKYYYVLCNGYHCYTELSRPSEESSVRRPHLAHRGGCGPCVAGGPSAVEGRHGGRPIGGRLRRHPRR